jgi:hypothetical protein
MAVAASSIAFTSSEQRSMLWLQEMIQTDLSATAVGPAVGTAAAVPSRNSATRACAIGETDVYGAQQHAPLLTLTLGNTLE